MPVQNAGRLRQFIIRTLHGDLGHLDAIPGSLATVEPGGLPALVGERDLRVHHVQVTRGRRQVHRLYASAAVMVVNVQRMH